MKTSTVLLTKLFLLGNFLIKFCYFQSLYSKDEIGSGSFCTVTVRPKGPSYVSNHRLLRAALHCVHSRLCGWSYLIYFLIGNHGGINGAAQGGEIDLHR